MLTFLPETRMLAIEAEGNARSYKNLGVIMSNEVNYIKPNGLLYTVSWMNTTQQELTGQVNNEFSLEIIKELDKAGFFYNPELTFKDNPEIINIVNEAGKKTLEFEDPSLARIIARELSFEGVHIPAK